MCEIYSVSNNHGRQGASNPKALDTFPKASASIRRGAEPRTLTPALRRGVLLALAGPRLLGRTERFEVEAEAEVLRLFPGALKGSQKKAKGKQKG